MNMHAVRLETTELCVCKIETLEIVGCGLCVVLAVCVSNDVTANEDEGLPPVGPLGGFKGTTRHPAGG